MTRTIRKVMIPTRKLMISTRKLMISLPAPPAQQKKKKKLQSQIVLVQVYVSWGCSRFRRG
eukprot:12503069-Heterocapsa_arctica.AAC.1